MIVPQFWAEGRIRQRINGRQFTVRRFGWSDESEQAAQEHADQRTREAFDRIVAGEKLERFERRMAYNGADGVPIREEIVSRQGDAVVTRNSYGARCLNTPDVLFADIDLEQKIGRYAGWLALLVGILVVIFLHSWPLGAGAMLLTRVILGVAKSMFKLGYPSKQQLERQARVRIDRFLGEHANWRVRLYRTPAGLRVMAMHRTFSAREPEVVECFKRLGVDPVYALMCRNQNCFRARVSAKPWRIGIGKHLRPQPGVWPVAVDKKPVREAWIALYERKAENFAACRFIGAMGNGAIDPGVQAVQQWHDDLCRAESKLPIA